MSDAYDPSKPSYLKKDKQLLELMELLERLGLLDLLELLKNRPLIDQFMIHFNNGYLNHLSLNEIANLITIYQNESRLNEIKYISFGSGLKVYPMEPSFVSKNYFDNTQLMLRLMSTDYQLKSHLENFWILYNEQKIIGPIYQAEFISILRH